MSSKIARWLAANEVIREENRCKQNDNIVILGIFHTIK